MYRSTEIHNNVGISERDHCRGVGLTSGEMEDSTSRLEGKPRQQGRDDGPHQRDEAPHGRDKGHV